MQSIHTTRARYPPLRRHRLNLHDVNAASSGRKPYHGHAPTKILLQPATLPVASSAHSLCMRSVEPPARRKTSLRNAAARPFPTEKQKSPVTCTGLFDSQAYS